KTQQAVDHLIRTYQEIKIHPECFDGQFIKLSFEQNNDNPIPLLALKTSPELENRIIAMQERVQTEEN
nr:hypothetical protein [Alcaligenaceae bacterium]